MHRSNKARRPVPARHRVGAPPRGRRSLHYLLPHSPSRQVTSGREFRSPAMPPAGRAPRAANGAEPPGLLAARDIELLSCAANTAHTQIVTPGGRTGVGVPCSSMMSRNAKRFAAVIQECAQSASGRSCCQRLTTPAMAAPKIGATQNSQS
jgi:hypothetical protein